MFAGQVPITNLFPIFLFSLLKMCHHYLHHVQDSSSDDANEEDIIATLHAAQAQHEHRSTPCWDGSLSEYDYGHHDRKVEHRMLYSDYFSQNPTMVQLFFDAGLQSVHNPACFHLQFSFLVFIRSGL
jgi:hypothetical protein